MRPNEPEPRRDPTPGAADPDDGRSTRPSAVDVERSRFGPGIYIHYPFCVQRCGYCDFYVVLGGDDVRAAFLESLLAEIELAAGGSFAAGSRGGESAAAPGDGLPEFSEVAFQTIFFGGGTPSLLSPRDLQRVLAALRAHFRFTARPEITVECNPESATRDRLAGYRAAGVGRVSFGVQSMDSEELRLLDRIHGAADVPRRMDDARAAGMDSVSLDLIYALPFAGAPRPVGPGGEADDPGADEAGGPAVEAADAPGRLAAERWRRTLDAALALEPDHLSAYLLTLEPHVPLARRIGRGETPALPGDELAREQYEMLRRATAARGLEQYEISNFAKPGHGSRHNQNYWLSGDYLGLGPSAHSHRDGVRWSNVRSLRAYRRALGEWRRPIDQREDLGRQERAEERVFLGLRRREGVPRAVLVDFWGPGAVDRLLASPRLFTWLEESGERIRLAPDALFVSNTVFAEVCTLLGPVVED